MRNIHVSFLFEREKEKLKKLTNLQILDLIAFQGTNFRFEKFFNKLYESCI